MGSTGNKTGYNIISAKKYNRGLILKLISTGECRSRIELAQATGLTKMTVSNIIGEYIAGGVIEEKEEEKTDSCGRNPVLLSFAPTAPHVIGLLIFRDYVEAVLCDMNLNVCHREKIRFNDTDADHLMEDCYEVTDGCIEALKDDPHHPPLAGIGVASIGPVDINRGRLLNPVRFYGIRDLPVKGLMEKRYGCPVVFDHDNNCAALAESMWGNGKHIQDFIFLGISNGIGSGIVMNGEVFHNRRGLAPEIGFITLDPDGPVGENGRRGYLELYASTYIVLKRLREATGTKLPFKSYFEMTDNAEVVSILSDMVDKVALTLANVTNVIHPERIILGHDCMDWSDAYVRKLEELVNHQKIASDDFWISICKAHFGRSAMVVGAAANMLKELFNGNVTE